MYGANSTAVSILAAIVPSTPAAPVTSFSPDTVSHIHLSHFTLFIASPYIHPTLFHCQIKVTIFDVEKPFLSIQKPVLSKRILNY